jgi:hypothetical protein
MPTRIDHFLGEYATTSISYNSVPRQFTIVVRAG